MVVEVAAVTVVKSVFHVAFCIAVVLAVHWEVGEFLLIFEHTFPLQRGQDACFLCAVSWCWYRCSQYFLTHRQELHDGCVFREVIRPMHHHLFRWHRFIRLSSIWKYTFQWIAQTLFLKSVWQYSREKNSTCREKSQRALRKQTLK